MPKNKKVTKIDDVKAGNKKSATQAWYNLPLPEIAKKLQVTPRGLDTKEAAKRLEEHGANTLPQAPPIPAVVLFLRQFKSALTYILLIAVGVSFYIGEHVDAAVIFAAVVVNVVVGFFQEYKAQNALKSLQRIVAQHVWVIRDGVEKEIDAQHVVKGDIVLLQAGNKVPADGRLFEAEKLLINESALTGESQPCEKIHKALQDELVLADQHNMVFTGTIVTEGRGRFFVTATGSNTELGKIATLVREAKESRTPLQDQIDGFSTKLGILVLILSALLFVVGLWYQYPVTEMFTTAVAVAVAAIPEGLVIAVTVILAVGMQRILKKHALVRKLVAAETLGSTDVICVDKTGTITLGVMRVTRFITAQDQIDIIPGDIEKHQEIQKELWELKRLHQVAVYCNDAVIASGAGEKVSQEKELEEEVVAGSPTESALLLAAASSGFSDTPLHEPRHRLDEIPFDSDKKFMATLNTWTKKQHSIYVKGAPEKILNMATKYQAGRSVRKLTPKKRKELLVLYEKTSRQGLRVLAGGYKPVPATTSSFDELPDATEDIVFVGFWGIKDPIRAEAPETIAETQKAGIHTIIITGDNKHTARAIAKELGLNLQDDEMIDGSEIAGYSEAALERAVKKIRLFSRATPEDKLRIVAALQRNESVVAMTGDGVNDAPALQKADIGVALGSGTDVAKETADMVLLNNNFTTIVASVRQGRVIYDNIRKVILYLLSGSFSEMLIIMIGLLLGWPLVLLPAQILWVNLVTDTFPHLALTQEAEEPETMSEPPRKRGESVLDYERKFLIVFISLFTALSVLGIFWFVMQQTGDLDRARTVAFLTLSINTLLYVFSVRSVRHSIFEINILSNRWLLGAVFFSFLMQIAGVYVPFLQTILRTVAIGLADWILVLFVCLWIIALIEIAKHYFIAQRK